MSNVRHKSLLIGINYTGSEHELKGCHSDVENMAEFLSYRGYDSSPRNQVIMRDDMSAAYYPSGHNILAAMDWLVSEPGTCNFLHYSGHGGQVPDPSGNRPSGLLDTICPVDFETRGQISSDVLHTHLVSRMPPNSSLFVVLDCCHSGSALELPFVYRSDDDGNVNMVDNIKEGMHLMAEGADLLSGGFSMYKLQEAEDMYAGATNFFRSFKHMGHHEPEGLGQDDRFGRQYAGEQKQVSMFSGCRDEQTSADARINGVNEGAMTWAFLETMKRTGGNPSYVEALQDTRYCLRNSNYPQVPQLSVGVQWDLNKGLVL